MQMKSIRHRTKNYKGFVPGAASSARAKIASGDTLIELAAFSGRGWNLLWVWRRS
jgi:hypothetical protein